MKFSKGARAIGHDDFEFSNIVSSRGFTEGDSLTHFVISFIGKHGEVMASFDIPVDKAMFIAESVYRAMFMHARSQKDSDPSAHLQAISRLIETMTFEVNRLKSKAA